MNPAAGNLLSYLVLPDGSKVEFKATEQTIPGSPTRYYYRYVAQAIIDPYSLRTTLTYNAYGLRVTEPAGRALQFFNTTTPWGDLVIDHVTATDGRTVQYHYSHSAMPGATVAHTYLDSVTYFGDSTLVARYTYQRPNVPDAGGSYNGVPLLRTCVDPMYAGPMWNLAYIYATANNPDGTPPVYGQIKSENYFDGTNIGVAVSSLTVNNTAHTRTETRGDGPSRTFTYSGNLLTTCTDFKGVAASQTYDSNKYVNSVTDRNGTGHTTNYTLNALTGRPTLVTFPATPGDAPAGRGTFTYTYGWAGCPDPNNRDPNNPYYLYSVTDEGGHATIYTRNANKRISRIDYPDNSFETFSYNGFGQVLNHYLTTGNLESNTYDASGLKTEYRDPYHDPVNKAAKPTARYQYDGYDRLYGVTDALGASLGDPAYTTVYARNSRGQVVYLTHPTDPNDGVRHFIHNVYNPNGTLQSTTDELGHITSFVYDAYKRIYTVTTPTRGNGDNSVNTTRYNYDPWNTTGPAALTANTPTIITSPAGILTWNAYDQNLRRIHVEVAPNAGPDQADTWFTYDNVGNLTQVQDPLNHKTTTIYDERNRVYQIKDALTNTTTFRYDAAGRKAKVSRANGQDITYDSYDAMNRLLQQTVEQLPNPSAVTKYTYDPSGGQLQTMTDPNGNVYTYGYDFLNRKTSLTYPKDSGGVQRTETWSYNNAGNGTLYQFKNRAGNIETFTYDNLNRVTLANWNDSVTPDVSTTYDAANRVTSITNANSTITRSYFNDNLLNTETNKYGDNIDRTVTYTYDADARRATLTYPNNDFSFAYAYTGRGQLDYIKDTVNIINFNYFRDGTVYQRALDNATNSFYGYDAMARVNSITHNLTGDTHTFGYDYDAVGNRKWVQRDGGNGDVYGYDLNDQSTAVKLDIANPDTTAPGAQTIAYDASGNRKSFSPYGSTDTYAANALNQYTTRNGNPAAYDLNGNMTTGFDNSTYTYDAQNRLLSAKKGVGPSVTFLYDGLNRQIGKKIGSQALYCRVYDGWDVLGEYKTGTSNAFWAYLYANGGVVKNLVTNNYYYQDASSSTSHVANASGVLKEYYRYDLQGKPLFFDAAGNQMSDTAIGVRHLFTGQQWYNEIGLYDLRNRYYSADIGRFLQADKIGFGGDPANLYRYCGNNPIDHTDPYGLETGVFYHDLDPVAPLSPRTAMFLRGTGNLGVSIVGFSGIGAMEVYSSGFASAVLAVQGSQAYLTGLKGLSQMQAAIVGTPAQQAYANNMPNNLSSVIAPYVPQDAASLLAGLEAGFSAGLTTSSIYSEGLRFESLVDALNIAYDALSPILGPGTPDSAAPPPFSKSPFDLEHTRPLPDDFERGDPFQQGPFDIFNGIPRGGLFNPDPNGYPGGGGGGPRFIVLVNGH